MGPQSKKNKSFKKIDDGGQVIVEYMLMVVFAITIVTIITYGFRSTLYNLWQTFTNEIAAGCPKCPNNPKLRIN